jgi:hypothetical protein
MIVVNQCTQSKKPSNLNCFQPIHHWIVIPQIASKPLAMLCCTLFHATLSNLQFGRLV